MTQPMLDKLPPILLNALLPEPLPVIVVTVGPDNNVLDVRVTDYNFISATLMAKGDEEDDNPLSDEPKGGNHSCNDADGAFPSFSDL